MATIPAMGKYMRAPKDFVVEEVIDPKFTRKFIVSGSKVSRIHGKHALCLLTKRGRTTESVLREMAGRLELKIKDIGYAGLKDKHAITSQYVTIKKTRKEIERLNLEGAKLEFLQYTNKHIARGDLLYNKFRITLHGVKVNVNKVRGGFPNYFGPQRFGARLQNHIIGRLLLQRRFAEAESLYNGKMPKAHARFFVHAYQSFLFNATLMYCIKSGGRIPGRARLLGYNFYKQKAGNIIEKRMLQMAEKDGIMPRDFKIDELRMLSGGSVRQTFVKPLNISVLKENGRVVFDFRLPKGSFASVFIQEVLKQ